MFKVFNDSELLLKTFDYYEIFNLVIDNPQYSFKILIDYKKISNSDFCNLFFRECQDFKDYYRLEFVLNKTKSIHHYAKTI